MKYLIVTLILLNVACTEQAEHYKISKQDTERVLSVIQEQENAWNQGNIENFMAGYWKSDSLRFSTSNGTRFGWSNTLKGYQKSFPKRDDMGLLSFEIDSLYTDRAPFISVQGKWKIERYDTIGGNFVLLFARKQGDWKIIEDHTW